MGHTQTAIADLISKELRLPARTGRRFLERFIEIVAEDIVYTHEIKLRGLGTFTVTVRPAVKTTHPVTGKPVYIPQKKIVHFRTSLPIRRLLNKKLRSKKAAQKKTSRTPKKRP